MPHPVTRTDAPFYCAHRIDLLAQVAADPDMSRADLYVDGQATRGMGQAMIERGEP